MEREHTVNVSVTNGAECICNPEILLGTNYGLWDFEKEIAPRGTLLDLNAAWELFLSRQGFNNNVKFLETYHHQHEIIDGIVYEDGDTTYTLLDDKGNPTNATFTIKANKGPVEHIEWQDGNLILYYTKTRPRTDEDLNSGIPIHYVYDESGSPIIDLETGLPLIYDYVKIPVIEIFDNDETHKLFPWFADDLHTVRTRLNIDEDTNEHLGDFAITKDSEVFIAKEKYSLNTGNTLISVQSVYDQLKLDLGFLPTFETINDLIDSEGGSIHLRTNGSTLTSVLDTENNNSIVEALNELLLRIKNENQLIWKQEVPITNYSSILNNITENIKNRESLVAALNWIQNSEIGNFTTDLTINANTITEALNIIFEEAENNKERIGWDGTTWIVLNTDNNSNLTEAINEVDSHVNNLNSIIGTLEYRGSYINSNIHDILKERLRPIGTNNNIKIVEAINDLQEQLGNLKSLTTSSNSNIAKSNIIESIKLLDTNVGKLSTLTTDSKNTIVEAINEIDSHVDTNTNNIGDLSNLTTDDKTTIVDSINEIISESPFIYQDPENSDSGVILKEHSNEAGKGSLVLGEDNSAFNNSFIVGTSNESTGEYTLISGDNNNSRKEFNTILGEDNNNNGTYNLINGKENSVNGSYNLVHGYKNILSDSENSVVIGKQNKINCDNVIVLGSNITTKKDIENSIGIGYGSNINGSGSISIGRNVVDNGSVAIGIANDLSGELNFSIGNGNNSNGNRNFTFGINQSILGNDNISIGTLELDIVDVNGAVVINGINKVHSDSTHIGKDIYIQSHETESKLQSLIFVDLNDWCKLNNSASLNGEKFLDTSHLVEALKVYLTKEYTDNAILRFKMLDDNENGLIIVQGKSKRIYLYGSWYFSDNIENGWSRHEGEYLKVIPKKVVTQLGDTITKYYLAFMDLLSTEATIDTVGGLRSNTEDFGTINLSHAYGAVDIDDIGEALDLNNRFNNKVDKSANIITNYYDANGTKFLKSLNFIDPQFSNLSADITLDLKESFGFDKTLYQQLSLRGQANGYVPLNSNATIDAQYLPSYIDDVVDVWAEYNIDGKTGAVINIKLYNIIYSTVPTTGQEVMEKGDQILEGESGKIYVEANNSDNGKLSCQFRWTGTKFVPIGFSNIVIGEVEGTAFDGSRGVALEEGLQDHLNSGTTTIPDLDGSGNQRLDENGNLLWKVYKPNPHNVLASLLLITVNDPNDISNVNLDDPYYREYNVESALVELFNRLNIEEDKTGYISRIIGTLDEILELGDDTIVGTLLDTKDQLDSISVIGTADILSIVSENFKLYGED